MDLEKCTVSALKAKCKAAGVAQSGEKPDLVTRLKQHAAGEQVQLDGENPALLKAGALKKALAVRGLPCSLDIESRDVLVGRLIDALKKEAAVASAGSEVTASASADDAADEAIALAVEMAKQVLALGEAGDAAGVLSLVGVAVTASSPFATQRKAYLQLSRMIHPDKLGRHFDGATRAFQALVRALDELSAPPAPDAPAGGKQPSAKTTISRSNEGCVRTKVYCPRCDAEWGTADAGLQPYDYNLMMQGLKLYCCALCLCEFGCVSAKHRCPHCHGSFAYHPKDFHKHVGCGNRKCEKSGATFGFMLYHIPARVENDLRATIKKEQEQRLKAREASAARQARMARKQPALSDGARRKQAEACFLRGLLDVCPRCGYEPPPGVKADELAAHLAGCNDAQRHAAHQRQVAAAEARAAGKAAVRDAEAEAQNLMAWQYLGGDTEQMWLLTDENLTARCKERGLEAHGSREAMLARLARESLPAERLLTDGGGGGSGGGGSSGGGARRGTASGGLRRGALPDNLHSMSLAQLRAVAASHGLECERGSSVDEIIALLERGVDDGRDEPLLLEGGGRKGGRLRAPAKDSDGEAEVDDDDDDDEDEPLSKRKRKKGKRA